MLTPMSIREGDPQSQCPGWAQGTPGVTEQTNHSCLASSSPLGHPDILDICQLQAQLCVTGLSRRALPVPPGTCCSHFSRL